MKAFKISFSRRVALIVLALALSLYVVFDLTPAAVSGRQDTFNAIANGSKGPVTGSQE